MDKNELRNSEFFQSLPIYVQESIMLGEKPINTEEDLRSVAENMMSKQEKE